MVNVLTLDLRLIIMEAVPTFASALSSSSVILELQSQIDQVIVRLELTDGSADTDADNSNPESHRSGRVRKPTGRHNSKIFN